MDLLLCNPNVLSLTELSRDRLYFVVLKANSKLYCDNTTFLNTDDEFVYANYYKDFGPLNISCLYKYCYKMVNLMQRNPSKRIVHYTSTNFEKKANAGFLVGCFTIIYLKATPKDVSKAFISSCPNMPLFHDASQGTSEWKLTLYDCFFAIYKALRLGFFHFDDFDVYGYDLYSKLKNGDINWILPNKFLAFIGPMDIQINYYHTPEFYIQYFITHDIKTVIRLNNDLYDKSVFTEVGIAHYDLYFPDGSTPPKEILMHFFNICENSEGAIAVHCKAGLGRTGSLIGAYLMKHYRLRAREAIAWLRICRPGSVIGPQQNWLDHIEHWLWAQGNQYRLENYGNSEKCLFHRYGIYSQKWQIERTSMLREAKQKEIHGNYAPSIPATTQSKNFNVDQFSSGSAKNTNNYFSQPSGSTQGDKLNSIKAYRNNVNASRFSNAQLYNVQNTGIKNKNCRLFKNK